MFGRTHTLNTVVSAIAASLLKLQGPFSLQIEKLIQGLVWGRVIPLRIPTSLFCGNKTNPAEGQSSWGLIYVCYQDPLDLSLHWSFAEVSLQEMYALRVSLVKRLSRWALTASLFSTATSLLTLSVTF